MSSDKFKTALDKACAQLLGATERRPHLGASGVGARCPRQIWYGFRWVYEIGHHGRLFRLFDRGHEEEHRVARWLRAAGVTVHDYHQRLVWDAESDRYSEQAWEESVDGARLEDVHQDPAHIKRATERGQGPRQWGFKDGHFAGSADGVLSGLERWFPQAAGRGLLECKTHNDKSFKQVVAKGVLTSKPVHYNQMQIYMAKLGLDWGLYVAVNKNDDDVYVELVRHKPEVSGFYIDRAAALVQARQAPPKITEDPSWYECKFCDFREICHYERLPAKNCRSCAYASAENGPSWRCNLHNGEVPPSYIPKGCDKWEPVK